MILRHGAFTQVQLPDTDRLTARATGLFAG